MSYILVKDVFDELIDENKRLFDELLFANKCINKLIELKVNFDLHSNQFKSSLDSNDWLKFERLMDELNGVVVKLNSRHEKPINSTVVSTEQLNTSSEASHSSFIPLPDDLVTDQTQMMDSTEGVNDSRTLFTIIYGKRDDEEYVPKAGGSSGRFVEDRVNHVLKPKQPKTKYKVPVDANLFCDWPECEFATNNDNALTKHRLTHSEKKYVCNRPECEYRTYKKSDLKTHLLRHCKKENSKFSESDQKLLEQDYECHCGRRYSCGIAYNKHLSAHNDTTVKRFYCVFAQCNYSTDKKNHLDKHVLCHSNEKPFQCSECDKSFKNEYSLKRHFEGVHKLLDRPMVCDIDDCNKEFRSESAFAEHQRNGHLRDRLLVCQQSKCNYKTCRRNAYYNHMATHSDEGPYKCTFPGCQRIFKLKFHFNAHIASHSTQRKYKCPHEGCGMAFKTRAHLCKHEKNRHKQKLLGCDWPGCEYRSVQESWVNSYSAVHQNNSDVSCVWPKCQKKFRSDKSMRWHLRVHKQEKRFACHWPGCYYRCGAPNALRIHMGVHTVEKTVVCDWPGCGKKFKNDKSMRTHLLIHKADKRHQCPWPGCNYRAIFVQSVKRHVKVHQK